MKIVERTLALAAECLPLLLSHRGNGVRVRPAAHGRPLARGEGKIICQSGKFKSRSPTRRVNGMMNCSWLMIGVVCPVSHDGDLQAMMDGGWLIARVLCPVSRSVVREWCQTVGLVRWCLLPRRPVSYYRYFQAMKNFGTETELRWKSVLEIVTNKTF